MSTLKVNKLRDTAGSADAITLDPNGGAVLAGVTTVSTVKVGSGVTISSDGDVFTTGITTSSTVIVGSGVTISESGIEASGIGVTCANINGGQIAGRRNIIINGAMNIAQRGTSHTPSNSTSTYQIDRFIMENSNGGAYTVSQSSTAPDNKFKHSLKVDVTTADTSLSSAQYCQFQQRVEGTNLTAVENFRQPMTFSFWVRSNKTGNYSFTLQQSDNSSRQMSGQYTISAANTWEKKIITVPADSSGAVNDDNGIGMTITWGLAYGSNYTSGSVATNNAFKTYSSTDFGAGQGVNLLDSTDNEWYLTGVQMEIGTQATPFEFRSFGEELLLCQRYYYNHADGGTNYAMGGNNGETTISENATMYQSSNMFCSIKFPTQMRAKPTLEIETGSNYYISFSNGASKGNFTGSSTSLNSSTSTNLAAINNSDTGSSTGGHTAIWRTSNAAARLAFTAEL